MDQATIRHNIVGAIRKDLSNRFRVIDNTGNDKRLVAGLFPDVLLMRQEPPENDDVLFVMRIETPTTDPVDSVTTWKELDRSEISFYLVVPEEKLDETKRLVGAIGIFAKFASYRIDHQGKARVHYE